MKYKTKIILVLLALTSCNTNVNDSEVILSANMQTPMGWNYLKIYKDNTFQFEHRKLLKKTIFTGIVKIEKDTLKFDYNESVPDFGNTAVIDDIFLTYTNGVYNELFEISINKLIK